MDTIDFAVAPGAPPITLGTPLPAITSGLSIAGPGSDQLAVNGNDAVRVLQVSAGGTATISGLTLEHGFDPAGAGIFNSGTGTVTLSGVTVTNSEARVTGGMNAFPQGGGVRNSGTLSIVNSTVSDNIANADGASNQTPRPEAGSGATVR